MIPIIIATTMSTHPPVDLERVTLVAREKWQHDPTLRADFCDDLESYVAYEKARAQGLVRILGERREDRK